MASGMGMGPNDNVAQRNQRQNRRDGQGNKNFGRPGGKKSPRLFRNNGGDNSGSDVSTPVRKGW